MSKNPLTYLALDSRYVDIVTEYCCKQRTRDGALILSMLFMGLRNSECRQLRIADVAVAGSIADSVTIRPETSKDDTERTVPIPLLLQDVLRSMLEGMKGYYWYEYCATPLFPSRKKGKFLTARQIQRIVKRHLMRAIGRDVHPHALRHTYASSLLQHLDVRTVQHLLGHKHIQTTEYYLEPNINVARAAVEKFVPILPHEPPERQAARKQTIATGIRSVQHLRRKEG